MKDKIRVMTSARLAKKREGDKAVKQAAARAKQRAREEDLRQRQLQSKSIAEKREIQAKLIDSKIQLAEQQSVEVAQNLDSIRSLLRDAIKTPPPKSVMAVPPKPTQKPFKSRAQKPGPPVKGIPPEPPSISKPRLEHFFPNPNPPTPLTPEILNRRNEQFNSALPAFDDALEKYEADMADFREKLVHFEESEKEKQNLYEDSLEQYEFSIEQDLQHYEAKKEATLAKWKSAKQIIARQNKDLTMGQSKAVTQFYSSLLKDLKWPTKINGIRVAYAEQSTQLVVELVLPVINDAIPTVTGYRYSVREDRIIEQLATARDRKSDYLSLVSQVVLRVAFEVYRSGPSQAVSSIVISGVVKTTDPRTGNSIRPCLVTMRVSRDEFSRIKLEKVDPVACLVSLKAAVSRRPDELIPVKPIVEFDMVDPRFVKEANILKGLDARPNLMELTPAEFESLITNLFSNMGLETRLTQASRDGGVDCVAYDTRPIFGGKVIIQAKRYKNKVGPSAVRDLFGAIHNEGATKGILITTSGYGPASYDFASNKPLELLDGTNLLYLLKEHAGVEAKIEIPDDWVDPVADSEGEI